MLDNSTENNSCGKGHLFAQCCILWWQFNLESDSYFLSDERKIHYNLAKAIPAPCKLHFVRVFACYILDDGSLWKSNIIPWQWVFISPYVPQVIFSKSIYTSWLKLIQSWLLLWLKLIDSYYWFCVQCCTSLQGEQYPGDLVVQQKCNSSPDV